MGPCDEDITPMHMTMVGIWHVKGVRKRCPSKEGCPRLIQLESPRWRPKAILIGDHLGIQEQPTPNFFFEGSAPNI